MSDTIVIRDWLAENRDGVAVVDVRRAWEYNETPHIPGAVNVPFESFRDPTDETPGKMPTASTFSGLLGGRGKASDDQIDGYETEFGVYASRSLGTVEVFGHEVQYNTRPILQSHAVTATPSNFGGPQSSNVSGIQP